jgi:hypothetical protein
VIAHHLIQHALRGRARLIHRRRGRHVVLRAEGVPCSGPRKIECFQQARRAAAQFLPTCPEPDVAVPDAAAVGTSGGPGSPTRRRGMPGHTAGLVWREDSVEDQRRGRSRRD